MKKVTAIKRNRVEISVQALLLAAGVIITVTIISLMVRQLKSALELSSAVELNIAKTTKAIRESDIVQYDGKTVTGTDVVNICRRFTGGEDPTILLDYNGASVVGGIKNITAATVSALADESSEMYVRPSGKWRCRIVRNENEIITQMIISAV